MGDAGRELDDVGAGGLSDEEGDEVGLLGDIESGAGKEEEEEEGAGRSSPRRQKPQVPTGWCACFSVAYFQPVRDAQRQRARAATPRLTHRRAAVL